MLRRLPIALFAFSLLAINSPADARCACLDKTKSSQDNIEAASAARRLPSEADRTIARDFRTKNMLVDAEQYYQTAATKATNELAESQEKLKQAAPLVTFPEHQQLALHSADIQREAASFFRQRGKMAEAAAIWEQAIASELAGNKQSKNLGTEYGTLARLYESAGRPNKAAEIYQKQIEVLAATKGRYSSEAAFAQAEVNRLRRLSYTIQR